MPFSEPAAQSKALRELIVPTPAPTSGETLPRPETTVASFAMDLAGGDPAWRDPVLRSGYKPTLLTELTSDALGGVDVLLLDLPSGARLSRSSARRVLERVEAGARLVVHDPSGRHLRVFADERATGGVTIDTDASGVRGLQVAAAASRTLLHYGPGGDLPSTPPGYYRSHYGVIEPATLGAEISPLLETDAAAGTIAFCQPRGEGSVVYSLVPLHEFLRGRQDSPTGEILREKYAPNLVAYAAWGGCNIEFSALPVAIDVIPGDPENRITRRGIRVAVFSNPLVDAVVDVNPESIRFGLTGVEDSRYRCSSRPRDLNHDGRADLECIFLYERTFLGKTAEHSVWQARTNQARQLYGGDSVQLPFGHGSR